MVSTFSTVHYTICSEKIPESFNGFRIVHLSDLHGRLHGKGNCELLRKIHMEKPDIIVMTGDMADESPHAVSRTLNLCRRLRKRYPVYYIFGNHEQSLDKNTLAGLMRELQAEGVILLENESRLIGKGTESIRLYGLVTPLVYYKDPLGEYQRGVHFSAEDTRQALGGIDRTYFNILLAHNPLYFPSYRDWGADLTLSGHVHGGIIRVPGLGGLLSPDCKIFPKYDGGYYREFGRHLIVSRGLGNRFLVRVNNPAELVVVELKSC